MALPAPETPSLAAHRMPGLRNDVLRLVTIPEMIAATGFSVPE